MKAACSNEHTALRDADAALEASAAVTLSPASFRAFAAGTYNLFQGVDLPLLFFDDCFLLHDLRLLLFDGIDQNNSDAVILDALDFAIFIRSS